MYFQFLIEDRSTNILVEHVMEKLSKQYIEKNIVWNIKPFGGIGHLGKKGRGLERKTGQLLNDLPMFLRGFSKVLQSMEDSALIIVLDNDQRDVQQFRRELENVAISNIVLCDFVILCGSKRNGGMAVG